MKIVTIFTSLTAFKMFAFLSVSEVSAAFCVTTSQKVILAVLSGVGEVAATLLPAIVPVPPNTSPWLLHLIALESSVTFALSAFLADLNYKEGRLECNLKYIEQICFRWFLVMKRARKSLLPIITSWQSFQFTVIKRSLLVHGTLRKLLKQFWSMFLRLPSSSTLLECALF